MKKLLLSTVIASTLGLAACGGDSVDDIDGNTIPLIPQSHLVFDPSNAKLPLPNDLLFNGTQDGTLQVPGEETGNYSDPSIALGALDGWSLTQPISIDVDLPTFNRDGVPIELSITAASVQQPGAVRVFEVTAGGPLSSDAECKAAPSLTACKVGDELQFGVDFVTAVSGSSIAIVPIKPLKAAQSYMYVTTDKIMDSEGRSIAASATYNLLKLDLATQPLGSDQQKQLQGVVNNYENSLQAAHDVDPASITYAGLYTTQSVSTVLEVTKAKMAADFRAVFVDRESLFKHPYTPVLVPYEDGSFTRQKKRNPEDDTPMTAADVLGITEGFSKDLLDSALVYEAKVRLPIYSECSSIACEDESGNLLTGGRWQAQGDSPVAVLLAVQSGKLSQADFIAQAVAKDINPQDALANPSLLVGQQFTFADGTPIDAAKHLTKFNPLPKIRGYETVTVQITVPQETPGNAIPVDGFPVVIGMHGISAVKEMSLVLSGVFAQVSHLATMTIDMPLHGGRSFKKEKDDDYYSVTATSASSADALGVAKAETLFKYGTPLAFVNVASPQTIRDNFRQGIIDQLALRLILPVISRHLKGANSEWATNTAVTTVLDTNGVTVQGLSLGAMISTDVAAYANSGVINPKTGELEEGNPFKISGVSLTAPSGGLAASFAGSASFGPTLYSEVQKQAQFSDLVAAAAKSQGVVKEDNPQVYEAIQQEVYKQFIPPFGFAVQTVIDSIDPINYARQVKASELPVHLIEIVGDIEAGGSNPSDRVLPNRFNGLPIGENDVLELKAFPLSGTEPLISALGLPCVSQGFTGSDDNPQGVEGSGVVRFTKGTHSSLVKPADNFNDGDPLIDLIDVFLEMQSEVAKFAETAHAGTPQIVIGNTDIIKSCDK